MEDRLVSLFDKIMLRESVLIESVNKQFKHVCSIEYTRYNSVNGFIVNVITVLIANTYFPNKLALVLILHMSESNVTALDL